MGFGRTADAHSSVPKWCRRRTRFTSLFIDVIEGGFWAVLTSSVIKVPVFGQIACDTSCAIVVRCILWADAFLINSIIDECRWTAFASVGLSVPMVGSHTSDTSSV